MAGPVTGAPSRGLSIMIKVLFFARLREELGSAQLELEIEGVATTVAEIIDRLTVEGGERWSRALGAANLVIAVNQRVCSADEVLRDGDELAIFPPVTGG